MLRSTIALFVLVGCSSSTDGGGPSTATTDTGVVAADTEVADVAADALADTSPAGACSETALDACEYPSAALEFKVRDVTVTEKVSGRVLPLRIRAPQGPGPYPVVVFTHGGGFDDGGHAHSATWGETLARHGYIVANIGHATLTGEQGRAFCKLGKVPDAECTADAGDDSGLVALIKRSDVVNVIDAIPDLARAAKAAGGPDADITHLGVIGWSAGSRSTMTSRGAGFYPSASAPVYSVVESRITAILALSPTGPGFGGFFEASFRTIAAPSLMATGDNDVKPTSPDLTGAVRRKAFDLQTADGARRLLFSKLPPGVGGHSTYNLDDLASSDPRLQRYSRALTSAARAFFDEHLRGDAKARAWLATDNARILAGAVDWVKR